MSWFKRSIVDENSIKRKNTMVYANIIRNIEIKEPENNYYTPKEGYQTRTDSEV